MTKPLFPMAGGRRRGFTLIELLVVIGIILVLISILVPVVHSVRHKAEIARIRQDLNTVSTALEEYKKVFYDYPRQANPNADPHDHTVLATYLLGPNGEGIREAGTGATGTVGGKKWGPYLPPDKFKIGTGTPVSQPLNCLLDSNGGEIQYYPRYNVYDVRTTGLAAPSGTGDGYLLGKVSVSSAAKTIRAMFNRHDGLAGDTVSADGIATSPIDHLQQTLFMLGDGGDNGTPPPNNKIDGTMIGGETFTESLTFNGPFILASPGPDRRWGLYGGAYKRHSEVDDVYNFER
jgi:prepilin-type N-terminal cleavage/methylation domain-containing protein